MRQNRTARGSVDGSYICLVCANEFTPSVSYIQARMYCSKNCSTVGSGHRLVCLACGDNFLSLHAKQKYCSFDCYNQKRTANFFKPCKQCGVMFQKRDAATTRRIKFCSRKCHRDYMHVHGSELRGVRFYKRRQDRGPDWVISQWDARERAGDKCEVPGCKRRTQRKPDVDHIVPYRYILRLLESDHTHFPNDQRNLVLMCRNHHMRKSGAELCLFRGDVNAYINRASQLISKERIIAALELFGIPKGSRRAA